MHLHFSSLMETIHLQLAAAILFLFLFLVLLKTTRRRPCNLPPGPVPLPIIGNLHLLGSNPHRSLQLLSRRYGPIIHLTLGEIPTVIVSSARIAREVLRTHDLALCSRPRIYAADKLLYNSTDMAFSPYGPYWRHVRKLCILELLSPRRVDSYASIREQEAARLVRNISATVGTEGSASVSAALGIYANAVLCRAAFGRDFSEGGGDYERHGFHEMLGEFQTLLGGLSIGDFFPSLEWVHAVTGVKGRLERTFKKFDMFFDEIIEEATERRQKVAAAAGEGGESAAQGKCLLDVLLDLRESSGMDMPLTMDNMKALILDMFAAGTDTAFITLDWAMTELIMNKEIMKKAQEEVRNIVGKRTTILETDLTHMHYLKAVIKETFRMHPPAPLLVPRESMKPVNIDGYEIPAKTRIFVNALAVGMNPENWERPEVFSPERFVGSNIDFKGQDFELIPFGSGRRICPAVTFGNASVEIALAQLLHSFDWELPLGTRVEDLDLSEVFGITITKKSELILVAKHYFV